MEAFEVKAKRDIPLENIVVKKDEVVTITKIQLQYYLWHRDGIYKIDGSYIGDIIRNLT